MSQNYHIFIDVSADFSPDVIEKEDIKLISMNYTLGPEDRCCECMQPEDIMKRFYDGQRNGDLTQTTQITPNRYVEIFEPYAKKGENILYISLSSGLSSTYDSSLLARNMLLEDYPEFKLECVDSLGATGGMGLVGELAAKNRAAGMSVEENAANLRERTHYLRHWFMVDDLGYLRRGGRVSGATAVIGSALNIKPILRIEPDGKLANFDKKRGAKLALKQLVDLWKESRDDSIAPADERLYICHGDAGESVDSLISMIREVNPEISIEVMMLSPIIGAHTGPGMVSILHWAKEAWS